MKDLRENNRKYEQDSKFENPTLNKYEIPKNNQGFFDNKLGEQTLNNFKKGFKQKKFYFFLIDEHFG